jgi:dTDP-4-amino-4,6-dideoxygalactose transaminase
MPPLQEFLPYLEQIWQSRWLTNAGTFHQELEARLAEHLGVEHLALFANATIALVTALQALRVTGKVITTPSSFVATAHSLLWSNLMPVFVDIRADDYNVDPDAIEAAMTPRTTAIMPVHCYGNACDVKRIQEIADRYGLRVI